MTALAGTSSFFLSATTASQQAGAHPSLHPTIAFSYKRGELFEGILLSYL